MGMKVEIQFDKRESTEAYARGSLLVNGEHRGLISMPASMWDYFIETLWDGHAKLDGKSLEFQKMSFSDTQKILENLG